MMENKYVIFCDIDDVMWNLMDNVINWYNRMTSSNIQKSDFKEWDISKVIPKNKLDMFWQPTTWELFWKEVEPRYGADKYAKKLSELYDLYFVTATDIENTEFKIRRFLALFPWVNKNRIIISHNKQLLSGDLMIDDALHNLIGFTAHKIIVNQPWNESCDIISHGLIRGYDWSDLYNKVCTILPVANA